MLRPRVSISRPLTGSHELKGRLRPTTLTDHSWSIRSTWAVLLALVSWGYFGPRGVLTHRPCGGFFVLGLDIREAAPEAFCPLSLSHQQVGDS